MVGIICIPCFWIWSYKIPYAPSVLAALGAVVSIFLLMKRSFGKCQSALQLLRRRKTAINSIHIISLEKRFFFLILSSCILLIRKRGHNVRERAHCAIRVMMLRGAKVFWNCICILTYIFNITGHLVSIYPSYENNSWKSFRFRYVYCLDTRIEMWKVQRPNFFAFII